MKLILRMRQTGCRAYLSACFPSRH